MKRVICLWLALVMALCLAACGGQTVSVDELSEIAVAEERGAAILSSETAIAKGDEYIMGETYSGTAYYVSNNGSDENDGLSPETPFATLEPFRRYDEDGIELQYGDAVFFERGSVWRAVELPGKLLFTEGLTLSAYGTGEKPAFYGGEENGAGAEKWSLYYEGDGGRKIWKFYRELTEIGAVVLDGETPAPRDIAWWDGTAYHLTGKKKASDTLYDVKTHLGDLRCFPELALPAESVGKRNGYVFCDWDRETGEKIFYRGPLYLRCDAGNPGELYKDIEFIEAYSFVDGFAEEQTYDNLCLRCYGMSFQNGYNGESLTCGGVIQNCEFGWIGGALGHYGTEKEIAQNEWNLFHCESGAIRLLGSGYTVRGNHIHDAYFHGILVEIPNGEDCLSDIEITDNLIEYAPRGIAFTNEGRELFQNVAVKGNQVLHSGERSYRSPNWEDSYCSALIFEGYPKNARTEHFTIEDNVFAFCVGPLIEFYTYSKEYHKIFSGNTYIQNFSDTMTGNNMAARKARGIDLGSNMQELSEANAAKYLGDETATIHLT